DVGSHTVTMAGVIGGSGRFTKNGDGTMVVKGSNTFAGSITVGQGTLQLDAVGTLPSGTGINVQTGGTFDLGHSATLGSLSGDGSVLLNAAITIGANDESS